MLRRKPNTSVTPFRTYVGPPPLGQKSLRDDGANGYRFELGLDRRLGKTVDVKRVTVFWCR